MKTPEEIKRGLEACRADECHGHHTGCPYDDDFFCIMHICGDALAYIEQMEKRASLNTLRDEIYEDAVVHGHFVHDGPRFSGGVDWWHCSSCGRLASGVETRFCYCPFCGAKMDGGDDGETD